MGTVWVILLMCFAVVGVSYCCANESALPPSLNVLLSFFFDLSGEEQVGKDSTQWAGLRARTHDLI